MPNPVDPADRLRRLAAEDVAIAHEILQDMEPPFSLDIRRLRDIIRTIEERRGIQSRNKNQLSVFVAECYLVQQDLEIDEGIDATPLDVFLELCEEANIELEETWSSSKSAKPDIADNQPIPDAEQPNEHIDEVAETWNQINEMLDNDTRNTSILDSMEARATYFDQRKLAVSTFGAWTDKVDRIREMEVIADAFYNKNLAHRALSNWQSKLHELQQKMVMLEEKEEQFVEWAGSRAAGNALKKWVLEHRANSFRQWRDARTGRDVLHKWRSKTRQHQEQEQQADTFRAKQDAQKALGKLHETAETISKQRYVAEIKERYEFYVEVRQERVVRKALYAWRQKAADSREIRLRMEATADTFRQNKEHQRTTRIAHDAIEKMYDQAMETKENAMVADEHYHQNLIRKTGVLSERGPWRTLVRRTADMEKVADEYRRTRDQQAASYVLRIWRQRAFQWARRAEDADALFSRHSRNHAIGYLRHWREATAAARGMPTAPPPTTPAGRRQQILAQTEPRPATPSRIPRLAFDTPMPSRT